MKLKNYFVVFIVLVGFFFFLLNLSGIKICYDPQEESSLPWKWYLEIPLKKPFDTTIQPGDYIIFKTDKRMLPYFKPGVKFGKRVIGMPGDILITKGRDFYLNNRFLARARKTDSKGNPAPLFTYKGKIPKDCYFVLGHHPHSFDSRYWGFVCKPAIIGKIFPLCGKKW